MSEAERQATERVAADLSITKERHLRELARIGYGSLKGMVEFDTTAGSSSRTAPSSATTSGRCSPASRRSPGCEGTESTKLKIAAQASGAAGDRAHHGLGFSGGEQQAGMRCR
jgi:hypothetical protein